MVHPTKRLGGLGYHPSSGHCLPPLPLKSPGLLPPLSVGSAPPSTIQPILESCSFFGCGALLHQRMIEHPGLRFTGEARPMSSFQYFLELSIIYRGTTVFWVKGWKDPEHSGYHKWSQTVNHGVMNITNAYESCHSQALAWSKNIKDDLNIGNIPQVFSKIPNKTK